MRYIIYKTIREGAFIKMHGRIARLIVPFESFLAGYGFKLTCESDLVDILGLDFTSYGDHYDGNIGFLFDDEDPDHQTFTWYVAKSFDRDSLRYSRKVNIVVKADLGYIEDQHQVLLNKAIEVYQNMREESLTEITVLTKPD